jgi:hypothetical protein
MPEGFHFFHQLIRKGPSFYGDHIGQPLMVKATLVNGLAEVHTKFSDVQEDLEDSCDDGRSSGRSYYEKQLSIFFHKSSAS